MSWKMSPIIFMSTGTHRDSLSDSSLSFQSLITPTNLPRRSSKVKFSCDIDVIIVEAAASVVSHKELWWSNEDMKISKKECVGQLQEIFRTNPSIRNGKQALQEFMRDI